MSIFPDDTINTNEITLEDVIQDTKQETMQELPLFKEYVFDFIENKFIYENGKMKIVEGLEAIKIWVYMALKIQRFRYLGYSWNYGTEIEELVGTTLSPAALESESTRLIEECLLINPYILSILSVNALITNEKAAISVTVNTVYGEVEVNVY